MASRNEMTGNAPSTENPVEKRSRDSRTASGFSARLFAGLTTLFAAEGCIGGLPPELGLPSISFGSLSSGNENPPPQERVTEAPRSTINDRYREMRRIAREELAATNGSPTQLPHVGGTEVFSNHEHGLRIDGGDQLAFNRAVSRISQATDLALSGRPLSVLVRRVESSLTELGQRGLREIANDGGESVSIRLIEQEAFSEARPAQGEGRIVMNANIPEDDDLTDEHEGAYGDGANQFEAQARALRTLVNTLTPMAGDRLEEDGVFRGENGAMYRLHHTHTNAVIYLNNLRTTYQTLPNGVVRATLHGGFRISALRNGQNPAPTVRPVQLAANQ